MSEPQYAYLTCFEPTCGAMATHGKHCQAHADEYDLAWMEARKPIPVPSEGARQQEHMRFVKKPIEVQAMRFDGKNAVEIRAWVHAGLPPTANSIVWNDWLVPNVLTVRTLEGEMIASAGDWIVKGIKGEFYPVKPDIFALTYKPASSSSADLAALRMEIEKRLAKRATCTDGMRCRTLLRRCLAVVTAQEG